MHKILKALLCSSGFHCCATCRQCKSNTASYARDVKEFSIKMIWGFFIWWFFGQKARTRGSGTTTFLWVKSRSHPIMKQHLSRVLICVENVGKQGAKPETSSLMKGLD